MTSNQTGLSWLFFLLIGAMIISFMVSVPKGNKENLSGPTTYSENRDGMKGLYLVLKELKKDIIRWKRPLPLLEGNEIGTLVVTNPRKPLTPKEKVALDSWFLKGGHVVLLHDGNWDIQASGYDPETQSFKETFKREPRLAVIKNRLSLSNYGLKNNPQDGVAIIQQILSLPGPVYFDEYHLNHKEKTTPWELVWQYFNHPVGWVTLHIIVFFFLYLLSTPNLRENAPENKKEVNLILARASFLEMSRAKEFARKHKRINHGY